MLAALGSLLRGRRYRAVLGTACGVVALLALTPYDSFVYLMPRYYLRGQVAHRIADEQLLAQPPPFPVDLRRDVALVMKSGYGTRDRIQGWLDAHAEHLNLEHLLLVADFESNYTAGGRDVPVHDAVGATIRASRPHLTPDTPRVVKYNGFVETVRLGDTQQAAQMSKEFGYELDIMKFVSGLQMAYQKWPGMSWYVMVDDDSYMIRPSMQRLLGQFNPAEIHYLGNPEGHWTGRFGHGGSIFMVSLGAMSHLFDRHPERVAEAHHLASTTATLGDWLLATTFNKIGVYVEEGHKRFFNGEDPWGVKITAERLCALILGFHELKTGDVMRRVGEDFGRLTRPVTWWDVWDIYGDKPLIDGAAKYPMRENFDYVGPKIDDAVHTVSGVGSAQDCLERCRGRKPCLAWTWEREKGRCHLSPWMVIGAEAPGKVSGVNAGRVRAFRKAC